MSRIGATRLASVLVALSLATATTALAADEQNVSGGLTAAGAPLAVHGYDPVAFFTEGVAMIGSAKYTAVHEGAAYRFVSEKNKSRFEKSPAKYLPQYGGFCAYGVSVDKKFDGDPRVFEIVDGKLYFNLNPEIQATWAKDIPGNIRKADRSWATIGSQAASEL